VAAATGAAEAAAAAGGMESLAPWLMPWSTSFPLAGSSQGHGSAGRRDVGRDPFGPGGQQGGSSSSSSVPAYDATAEPLRAANAIASAAAALVLGTLRGDTLLDEADEEGGVDNEGEEDEEVVGEEAAAPAAAAVAQQEQQQQSAAAVDPEQHRSSDEEEEEEGSVVGRWGLVEPDEESDSEVEEEDARLAAGLVAAAAAAEQSSGGEGEDDDEGRGEDLQDRTKREEVEVFEDAQDGHDCGGCGVDCSTTVFHDASEVSEEQES